MEDIRTEAAQKKRSAFPLESMGIPVALAKRSTFASLAPRRRKGASLRVVRGLSRGWARGPGLGGSLAEFQGHNEPASRMDQMVFALRPPGQQVEMLAEMLEVLKAPFDQMPARSRALGFDANRGRERESGCCARPARWQEPREA
jgi:hypothetical protein